MDFPNIKEYNLELKAKRIKWVEEKKRNPFWKSSLRQEYDHNLTTAKNLHLKFYPIELYTHDIFPSAFINKNQLNLYPLISSNYYSKAKALKVLISENELDPERQKKMKKNYQLFINSFKANVRQNDIYPSILNYLDLSLDDIISYRAEICSLQDTLRMLYKHKWFTEFIEYISNDGTFIENSAPYKYYREERKRLQKEKLSFANIKEAIAIDNILDENSFDYKKYIVAPHLNFFSNVCFYISRSNFNLTSSKSQIKIIISNFTKLYKLIFIEEMREYQKKMNVKKTGERRGKSTRSVDNHAKIQHLKEQGYNKTQIQSETGLSLPTIRKYWDFDNS